MATYLPVLLVSVTNAVPDDSFVATQPKGQVDYLSHEWQEEDVWKSWRNMTRQKNEIANGVRLENASWRTWWKKRNKLKTVTPETLNWLKDSDVTWLYGPLHTAIEPPPPPKQAQPHSASAVPTKPILKHRSISELLTSDLPTSPVFSPAESDDDEQHQHSIYDSLDLSNLPPKRPTLQHTKSDTHITRWGPNRAFRKDSPPRIDPPGQRADGYFPSVQAAGPVRASQSQESSSSSTAGAERTGKKKHISFNTFVEQCIAIEKPKRSSSFYGGVWGAGRNYEDDDDGYEEDQESSPEDDVDAASAWDHQRIPHASGSDSDSPFEEEEDGVIEMRTSYRNTPKKSGPRSQSKVSNASSSSSASTASSTTNSTANSSSPSRRTPHPSTLTRRPSSSTYRPRPPLIRTSTSEHIHVTIAPIAPTVLKTTGAWEEGFGDDGAGSDDGFGWRDRMWSYNEGKKARGRKWSDDDSHASDGTPVELVYVPPFNSRYYCRDGELVDGDAIAVEEEEEEVFDDEDMEEVFAVHARRQDPPTSEVYHHRDTLVGSVGFEDYPDHAGVTIPIHIPATRSDSPPLDAQETLEHSRDGQQIPLMERKSRNAENDDDQFDIFGGPDLGEEYMNVGLARDRQPYSARAKGRDVDERQSRSVSRTASSRSRSKSRTPSPMIVEPSTNNSPLASSTVTLQPPTARPTLRRSNSSTTQSPTQSTLLPPARGRSASHQDLLQASRSASGSGSRGRSTTRTPPSSIFDSSSASPLGSLSPDASASPRHAVSAYVGGGRLNASKRDRDSDSRRGRETCRDRGRGRSQTTDKRLSVSLSSSPEPPRSASGAGSVSVSPQPPSSVVPPPATEASFSSSSSTNTIMPAHEQEEDDREAEYMRLAEAELRRKSTPTPSNSPVIEMRAALVEPPRVSGNSTPTLVTSTPTKAHSPTPSTKNRPPPLAPSPPHAAPPSTSYMAVSSPSPTSPKGAMSPRLMTSAAVVGGASPIVDGAATAAVTGGGAVSAGARPPLQRSPDSDASIIGKAAEIVTSAGAFFGLWNHS